MKIAICDDELDICGNLENIIERYFKEIKMDITVDIYYSADSLLDYIKSDCTYDLIFLDIEMDGTNGVELGNIIRNKMNNESIKIIYISWQDSYAMDLFKVRPLDFIIKPITVEKIYEVLNLCSKILENDNINFMYQSKGESRVIKLNDIMYISSTGRKVTLYTKDQSIEFVGKLDEIMKRIDHKMFWRIHKSYIINFMYAKKIEYTRIEMKKDVSLSISQKYRVEIRDKQKNLGLE